MTIGAGIIVDHRHNDASLPSLIDHILHILAIWVLHAAAPLGILILGLIQDDWSAICDLSCSNGARNIVNVAVSDVSL